MLKPSAVNLKVKLWKLFFPQDKSYIIPTSGLNFLKDESSKNSKFLLICGFESFNKFYVRVDILERLFVQIIENTKKNMFKVNSDMINLLGCSKENFFILLELMQYKKVKNDSTKDDIFVYRPKKIKMKNEKIVKNNKQNSPFRKLSEIRFG